MRAAVVRRFGDPEGIEIVDVPTPTPGPGQVAIDVEAIGVGGVDTVVRRGTLAEVGPPAGLVLGSEVAGTVAAAGPDMDPSWVGRRVWAFTGLGGGYAEVALAAGDDLTPLPDALTPVEAVTLGSAATVAHFALRHARLAAGGSVLVRGGAGSIGIAAVELAAAGGASTVAVTTSSPERGARLRQLGATDVLDRGGNGGAAAPACFDVIIDIVGGSDLPAFVDRLAPNGRLVLVGMVAGPPPADFGLRLTSLDVFQQSRSFATFSLGTVPVPERNRARADILTAAADGRMHAVVHDVLPLAHAATAHRLVDSGEVFGRIVLTP